MRPIDADELKRDFCTGCIENCPNECDEIRIINSQPTIDAEPVRRGTWEDMGDFEQCSICNSTHLKEFQSYYGKTVWIKTPYCPNCGAKMEDTE